eukprot:6783177-Ditylum_brightwellii.AAC.1
MENWEKVEKDRDKERAKKEEKFSQALVRLKEATKKNEESSLACKLAKLSQWSAELKKQTDNIDAWQIIFNEEQKQILREQDKKIAKKLDAQSQKFNAKMES